MVRIFKMNSMAEDVIHINGVSYIFVNYMDIC